jgi:prevent-host-death family protein
LTSISDVNFGTKLVLERAISSPAFDIKTQLSDLVETALKQGPQVVTKDGVETAVLVSIEDWKHLKAGQPWKLPPDPSARSLKDILLDPTRSPRS